MGPVEAEGPADVEDVKEDAKEDWDAEQRAFLPPMGTPLDRSLRLAAERVVGDERSVDEDEEPRIVTNAEAGLVGTRQFRFVRWVMAFIVGTSLLGGTALFLVEKQKHTYLDCVFLSLNCLTATGLSCVAMDRLSPASHGIVVVLMQLGSAVLLSLVPVVLRLRALERALPRCDDPRLLAWMLPRRRKFRWWSTSRVADVTFDLDHYRVVPQWLVEYKALVLLVRVVLLYQVACYVLFFALIRWYVGRTESAFALGPEAAGVGLSEWCAFTVVSAFTNCGLTLQSMSFRGFERHGVLLFLVG